MNTLQASIVGASCEYNLLLGQSCNGCIGCGNGSPLLDLPDSPAPSNLIGFFNSSSQYYITAPIGGYQFGYLRWLRGINDATVGLPNHFTWLNAWNPSPALPGTIRQGFAQTTHSVNPYAASTVWDLYIVGDVYDSLYQPNPLNSVQLINWMTIDTKQFSNSSLTYQAPPHTVTTYRFTLRPDLFFQDGRPVTAYDVAFSYLSMVGTGAFLGTAASGMTGITVLGPRVFDISVGSTDPFVILNLTSLPILPGRYWTIAGSAVWDAAIGTCTSMSVCSESQYTLTGSTINCPLSCATFAASLMTVNPADTSATFDPIANHIFVGSGPWQCGTVTNSGSGLCSSTGTQNPPLGDSYTLTRFGYGLAPGSSGTYFRSAGDLALWTWASNGNAAGPNIVTLSQVALCFGLPLGPSSCTHWQEGIGASSIGIVGISQIAVVAIRYNVNWITPFNWQTDPPLGLGQFAPVLYEGSVTLNPASVVGCPSGYDC